ncbi:hypothetical protein SAMN05216266_1426 [Amycolatopsis marina]|uniref:Cholesterol esterase n=2 Tax=Pseudonocardiaceae TaxID=2070 RepID=A0A1I1CP78_9PSEU|nr:DUF6230 family protein [Amycolatopsis marina]TWE15009.1 hypothetical protein FHX69_7183 [Prauserella muralis]SDU62719.1 hypothetical protein SAMN04489733_7266 [Amycolatopsis keratiniphila]SFB64287.1 hypothetical protein SAMN05216266_1426 [Amycolatopsis marina]
MATVSRHAADSGASVGGGRTRWRRFVGLLTPALIVVVLMVGGMINGVLPISIAAEGQRRIKIEIDEMSATGYGTFPQFFETQDGRKHTVVVVGLSGVRATGLCGSGKARTPFGDYVLRVETRGDQRLQADDVKFAIENIDGADLAGGTLTLNRHDTAPDGTPVDSGHEGTLPITARSVLLDLHADVRWVTTSGLKLSAVDLTAGTDVKECF